MKIVLATNNAGKIAELNEILKNLSLEIIAQAKLGVEEVPETGLSFIENALIKARHASLVTGLPAIADDSGLVVPALKGAPGIYSARYSGPSANAHTNIEKLLTELKHVPDSERRAYFYCVLVFLLHPEDPTPIICQGKWSGIILHTKRGEQGFGYDPVFFCAE